jgi:hypothetical protein
VELDEPPPDQLGDGKVYHARINRYTEQKFGTPRFQRTLRWYTAYNDFVKARIDVAQATAAFIMKRKVKGTPNQLARDASKLLSRRSCCAGGTSAELAQAPTKPGSILEENESASARGADPELRLGAGPAGREHHPRPDLAAERFSQAYFGDASNSNLATATSLELPILKAVETRQEVVEGIFRWFIDRVIEKAVDEGRIKKELAPEEIEDYTVTPGDIRASLREACDDAFERGRERHRRRPPALLLLRPRVRGAGGLAGGQPHRGGLHALPAGRGPRGQAEDEVSTERDLGYEFSMPSPLRRMMADLISSIVQIAQTFDPNNTNPELSRRC